MRRKILFFHAYYITKGGECTVFEEESKLMESSDELVTKRIFFENIKMKGFFGFYLYVKFILNYLYVMITFKPDVVHFHNIFPFHLIAPIISKCFNAKNVITVHNYRFKCMNGLFYINGSVCEKCIHSNWNSYSLLGKCYSSNLLLNLYAWFYTLFYMSMLKTRIFSKVIALTNFSKLKMIESGLPVKKIVIKSNFVHFSEDYIYDKNNEGNFIYIGRLSEEKGVLELVEFWMKRPPLGKLVIYGDGPLREKLSKLCHGYNHIVLGGRLSKSEVLKELRRANALIFPTKFYEAQPLILIEAMICNTRIIASKIGAVPEVLAGYQGSEFFELDKIEVLEEIISSKIYKKPFKANLDAFTSDYTRRNLVSLYKEILS